MDSRNTSNNGLNSVPENSQGFQQTTIRTTGRQPRTLHVAHRRSPSEFTNLMVEQFNLQQQLDLVQAQQQQILQQQQQLSQHAQATSGFIPQMHQSHSQQQQQQQQQYKGNLGMNTLQPPLQTSNAYGQMFPPSSMGNKQQHHRRTSSNTMNSDMSSGADNLGSINRSHRRAQSSISGSGGYNNSNNNNGNNNMNPNKLNNQAALGHNRRHSLGLSEAKRAAAQVQAQRTSHSPSKPSISAPPGFETQEDTITAPPSFKFPPAPTLEVSESSESTHQNYHQRGHSRSKSIQSERSPQRSFQFPPRDTSELMSGNTSNSLAPPAPNFMGHERRQSNQYSHKSNNSDINSNWRRQQQQQQSGDFTPGHRPRSSMGGSVSSLAQFNSNPNGQRKSLFAPYLPQSSLPELINEGRLVTGVLRVNKKNRSDAYVSTDGLLDADIFICGSKDRNRALEGDLVAIELLVVDEVWTSKREKEEKKRRKDTTSTNKPSDLNDDLHNDASTNYSGSAGSATSAGQGMDSNTNELSTSGSLNRRGSLKLRPTQKKNDDVEVEGQSLLLVEEEEISDDMKPLFAGHVVAVVDRIPGQLFSGTLGLYRPSQASKVSKDKSGKDNEKEEKKQQKNNSKPPNIVWFKPTDKKVPLIAIPTEQAPKDFVDNHEKYANQVFIASIKRWPITSLHPFGTLVSQLGAMNEDEVEIDSILRDNNFLCDEYPDDDEKYLTDVPDLSLNLAQEQARRRVFEDEFVIAFSQVGSFSDHAFHVKIISDTKIELAVHIADATYFIKQGSSLDRRSKKRSHSVFLPQKAVHLFPSKINDMISFKKDTPNVALSVVFEIDSSTFKIDDVWMGETIVTPKQVVEYEVVDSILGKQSNEVKVSETTDNHITTLSLISRGLKRNRLGNPNADILPTLPLFDQLDDERVKLCLNIFDTDAATTVIDEIFYNVNAAVAQKIHATLGDRAFLRKYPIPPLTKLESYHKKITNLGVDLDTTNASTIINSLLAITDKTKRQCVEAILIKLMTRGKYVVAGKTDPDSLGHYLFNLPTYTHFTAPLRRYADIIVHRQLKAVVNKAVDSYKEDIDSLKMNSDYCNFKKDCSKSAQDQAIHLLLCQTINEMSTSTGQLLCMATVVQVYESAFDVFIPELGIEKRVHGDQLPLRKAEFDKNNKILDLFWEPSVDSATYIPDDENEPLSYRASIKNKFRSTASDAAAVQRKSQLENNGLVTASLINKLANMKLSAPEIVVPTHDSHPQEVSVELHRPDPQSSKSMPEVTTRPPISPIPSPVAGSAPQIGFKVAHDGNALSSYLNYCITKIEGDNYIQQIKELQQVPVMVRAEVGMALPCLTVRSLNPFATTQSK